jgi:signal transduction histidine kinase
MKKIHQTTRSFEKEEIAITNSTNDLIYGYRLNSLTQERLISHSYNSNVAYFAIGDKDGVSYRHQNNEQLYHVIVLAHDKYRFESLRELRIILLWSILFSAWLSITASYFFSKVAIRPISNIIQKIKEINSSKLNSRLDEGNRKDEIEQLSITFNQMLSDLEMVFKSQDEFVSHASHEMRTPFAIMIAESDYILSRERQQEEYIKHIKGLTDDLRNLNLLLNSLLELAQINRNNVISKSMIRIDELIFSTIKAIKGKYPGRKILPKIDYPENENDLMINGNPGLLEIAFKNLIDNACKFSEDEIEIKVSFTDNTVHVSVLDHGIGIPESEIDSIFLPFTRGTNVKYIGGFGVGLSMVAKIIQLHNAEIKLSSIENHGSAIELIFPKD